MAADDWAIVVGINAYPGLSEAVGAEDDARAFRDWLADPDGGDLVPDNDHVKLIVTYHPAALLRNPQWKRPTWEDMKLLRREYDGLEL